MPYDFSVPQAAVSCQTAQDFVENELTGIGFDCLQYMYKTEPPEDKKKEVAFLGATAMLLIESGAAEGVDLVAIRKASMMFRNGISDKIREISPFKVSSPTGFPGIHLPMDPQNLIPPLKQATGKYGEPLTIEDEDGRRFAKASMYNPKLLPGFDGDTRVYHCHHSVGGCEPLGSLTRKLPGHTKQEIEKGNFTVCNYVTHDVTEVSEGLRKPVQGVAVGVKDDPEVCKALFLESDAQGIIKHNFNKE